MLRGIAPSAPRLVTSAALLLLAALPACGKRQVAYQFRAPLVRSVSAPPLPPRDASDPRGSHDSGPRTRPGRSTALAASPEPPRGPRPPPPRRLAIPAEPLRATNTAGDDLAARLRAHVGARDEDSHHVTFALTALRSIGSRLDPELAGAADGHALVEIARQRGALAPAGSGEGVVSRPRLGDLLVFDNVTGTEPASLVAVAVSVDDRGVVEFIYLARGVVRRGFVAPARPRDKRDEDGRVLNTFVRHSDGRDPGGTRYLAGELLAATIRLAALLR